MQQRDVIDGLRASASELAYACDLMDGVVSGTPWVIQLCESVYLTPKGDNGYGPGSILRTCCYSPGTIDAAVEVVKTQIGSVFPNVRKILRREALQHELASVRALLFRLDPIAA